MIVLKGGGKVSGGSIIVYTNAPESVGYPLAIFKEATADLEAIRAEYDSSYISIRWAIWENGNLPLMNNTFELGT